MNPILIKHFLGILFLSFISTEVISQKNFIPFNHPNLVYEGRIGTLEQKAAEFYWSGTSVSIDFEGSEIRVIMNEEFGGNYYDVILDGEFYSTIQPDTSLSNYLIAENLTNSVHTLEMVKRTEYTRGKSWFYGFELSSNSKIFPKSDSKKHKIEYYGDSITAGYSVDDYSGNDSPDSIHTNYRLSYAHLIAEYFNAEQYCVCRSGIGITISWFPTIMPEIWDLTNPSDPKSNWEFSNFTPDLVIVNLLQNDSWIINLPDHPSFKTFYGNIAPTEKELIEGYANFLQKIRSKYPETTIIATLGNMDITREGSEWPSYVDAAVASLNDQNIYTTFTPYKNTSGHPKVEEQKLIAENLISFIEKNLGW